MASRRERQSAGAEKRDRGHPKGQEWQIGLERIAVHHERRDREKQQRGPQRMRRESPRQRPHGRRGNQREQRCTRVERHFLHIAENGQRAAPGSRRPGADAVSRADPRVRRERRIRRGWDAADRSARARLRPGNRVVALNRLVEKRQPEQQHQPPALAASGRRFTPASIAISACARR